MLKSNHIPAPKTHSKLADALAEKGASSVILPICSSSLR